MAASFDQITNNSGAFSTGQTVSVNVGATANYLIFDFTDYSNAEGPVTASPTFNGVALTKQAAVSLTDAYCERWVLKNPATGTHDLVYALDNASFGWATSIHSYISVDGDNVTFGSTSANVGTGPYNQTISSAVGDLVVDLICSDNGLGVLSATAGQTERNNTTLIYAGAIMGVSNKAGAASVTMGWSNTLNSPSNSQIITNLKASGSTPTVAAGITPNLLTLGVG